jgi:hypothetical protein
MGLMSDYDLTNLPEHGIRGGSEVRTSLALNYTHQAQDPNQESPRLRSSEFEAAQWVAAGPGVYAPSGRSFPSLPPGFYTGMATQNGHYAVEQPLVADNLEILPGSCNESVVAGIRRFWNSRDLDRCWV